MKKRQAKKIVHRMALQMPTNARECRALCTYRRRMPMFKLSGISPDTPASRAKKRAKKGGRP